MKTKLEEVKKIYKNQEIPEELKIMVDKTIKESKNKKPKSFRYMVAGVAAAVAISGTFIVEINTNQAFAKTVEELPILSSIAKVFTFRDFEVHNNVVDENVKVPSIDGLSNKEFQKKVNDEIQKKMNLCLAEAEQRAAEYKEAYLSTGGTEEDYTPIEVVVDYKLFHANEDYISFVVYQNESLSSAYSSAYYYNINMKNNENITLKSLFGENYKEMLNKEIKEQINNSSDSFFEGDLGFKSIKDNQNFYLNEAGNAVIVFDKYEIAPGCAGKPEFEIKVK